MLFTTSALAPSANRPPMLPAGLEPYPGYRLCAFRGSGGFGEVWEAEGPDGTPLAIKFLHCDANRSAQQEMRAIRLVRDLQHPNLVRIDRVWAYRQYIVIAMELADAGLDELLRAHLREFGTPIPSGAVCHLLADVARTLDFLNARRHRVNGRLVGIQHRDVKPSNILICGDTVKLCDFGLAAATAVGWKQDIRAGTPDYAAPEVFLGRLSDRSDQYSLAVTYCVLRTGRYPFRNTPADFGTAYARPAPDLNWAPPTERAVLERALRPQPEGRWPSCETFLGELRRAVAPEPREAGTHPEGA